MSVAFGVEAWVFQPLNSKTRRYIYAELICWRVPEPALEDHITSADSGIYIYAELIC